MLQQTTTETDNLSDGEKFFLDRPRLSDGRRPFSIRHSMEALQRLHLRSPFNHPKSSRVVPLPPSALLSSLILLPAPSHIQSLSSSPHLLPLLKVCKLGFLHFHFYHFDRFWCVILFLEVQSLGIWFVLVLGVVKTESLFSFACDSAVYAHS